MEPKIPLREILVENSTYVNMAVLKRRLIRAGILQGYCEICGISDWMGSPISLHIDHINGINNDNRIGNLQLLCPNCHSQTDTYAGKNKNGGVRKKFFCLDCGVEIKRQSHRCRHCAVKNRPSQSRIEWPSNEELKRMVDSRSMLSVSRELGVSDNAIRKRLGI